MKLPEYNKTTKKELYDQLSATLVLLDEQKKKNSHLQQRRDEWYESSNFHKEECDKFGRRCEAYDKNILNELDHIRKMQEDFDEELKAFQKKVQEGNKLDDLDQYKISFIEGRKSMMAIQIVMLKRIRRVPGVVDVGLFN